MRGSATRPVCANIGPRQRRLRRLLGVVSLAATAVTFALLLAVGAAKQWRAALALPLWIGILALLEARAQTCVVLAARGRRNLDRGEERIEDASERALITAQARRVHVQAAVGVALAAAILLLLP
jgi:hypothetical protein